MRTLEREQRDREAWMEREREIAAREAVVAEREAALAAKAAKKARRKRSVRPPGDDVVR
jgi:hypothetical protein